MGLRKDLDSIKIRYVYLLKVNGEVIYVGTTCNAKSRYKSHLKRTLTDNSLLYRYLKAINKQPIMEVVKKIQCTYNEAEKHEIELIQKYFETTLNFYNNPNKKRYNEVNKKYQLTL